MNSDEKEKMSDNQTAAESESEYDKPGMKHTPGNQPDDELRSLQERLEQYKKDPAGMPGESAFEKLLYPTPAPGSDVC